MLLSGRAHIKLLKGPLPSIPPTHRGPGKESKVTVPLLAGAEQEERVEEQPGFVPGLEKWYLMRAGPDHTQPARCAGTYWPRPRGLRISWFPV